MQNTTILNFIIRYYLKTNQYFQIWIFVFIAIIILLLFHTEKLMSYILLNLLNFNLYFAFKTIFEIKKVRKFLIIYSIYVKSKIINILLGLIMLFLTLSQLYYVLNNWEKL
jgi:hypothetical protein